jgi:hypothetical protein
VVERQKSAQGRASANKVPDSRQQQNGRKFSIVGRFAGDGASVVWLYASTGDVFQYGRFRMEVD